MPKPSKQTIKLPVGARVISRDRPTTSIALAEDLARKGASDALVVAIGGDKALAKVRASRANGTA